jgi:Helix-hairpin-helix motif
MKTPLLLLLFAAAATLSAQTDSLLQNEVLENIIEEFAQDQQAEDFDYDDVTNRLEYLHQHPLNLNRATRSDLQVFPFLTGIQIEALLAYRSLTGDFVELYELQAVPGFDLNTIFQLLPYVGLRQPLLPPLTASNLLSMGQHEILLRWTSLLEEPRGYSVPSGDSTTSRYLGDRNRLYVRYRFNYYDRLSVGFTAEKDAGEEFFKGQNPQGFDFYSAHVYLNNPGGKLRAVALGDYDIALGQGLVLYQGFAPKKGAFTTAVKRTNAPLKPHTSVNEVDFYRGAAAIFAFGKNMELLAFGSTLRRDGNQVKENNIPDEPDAPSFAFVSSLQSSGLHRTPAEIADEKSLRQTTAGSSLSFQNRKMQLGLNAVYERLSQPLALRPALYNRYYFSGDKLLNFSADYTFHFRNFHFFGEAASSDNGAVATLNGLLFAVDPRVEFAILDRRFPRDFQSLHSKPFAESTIARNESGTYFGLTARPTSHWRLNAYFDLWHYPWVTFSASAPTAGNEWLVRLTYSIRKKMEAYAQLKNERKDEDLRTPEAHSRGTATRQNMQFRLHLSYKLSKNLEWRNRLDAGFSDFDGKKETGVAFYQDIIFRSINSPLSLSLRAAIFDTESYNIRFYWYENDILNTFSIPAYYGQGTRFYLNLRYRGIRHMTIEVRYARSWFPNQKTVGSGLDEIPGNTKSEVKVQLRYVF